MKRLTAAATRKMTAPFHNRIRKVCPLMAATLILPALTISFAVPTFAQQTNKPDPQLRDRLIALIKTHTDALDQNDAAAVAAKFKEDGVLVEQDGPVFGREAIQKLWADRFQKVHFSNSEVTVDEDSPHIIGTDGKAIWASGGWSEIIQGQNFGPTPTKGHWSVIRDGDDWKIRMLTVNTTPAPAATATTQETNKPDAQQKDAQAPEKKKITGTNKFGPPISRTVVPPGPGDDPKHELVVLAIYRATTTSPDPDFDGTEVIIYEQADSVAGTGTSRGYFRRLHKNGDTDYGSFESTHKTSFKEDGSWLETTFEGTWKSIGGTGKFKNTKGSGTDRGKATAEGTSEDWEGEAEY